MQYNEIDETFLHPNTSHIVKRNELITQLREYNKMLECFHETLPLSYSIVTNAINGIFASAAYIQLFFDDVKTYFPKVPGRNDAIVSFLFLYYLIDPIFVKGAVNKIEYECLVSEYYNHYDRRVKYENYKILLIKLMMLGLDVNTYHFVYESIDLAVSKFMESASIIPDYSLMNIAGHNVIVAIYNGYNSKIVFYQRNLCARGNTKFDCSCQKRYSGIKDCSQRSCRLLHSIRGVYDLFLEKITLFELISINLELSMPHFLN